MQFKILLICSIVGLAMSQRGHYAGNSRPILGSRYQNSDSPAAVIPAAIPSSNNIPPEQSQFTQQQGLSSRFEPEANSVFPQNNGFVGGFPNQGFQGREYPFAPVWFYG